jgi:hypothetical protein
VRDSVGRDIGLAARGPRPRRQPFVVKHDANRGPGPDTAFQEELRTVKGNDPPHGGQSNSMAVRTAVISTVPQAGARRLIHAAASVGNRQAHAPDRTNRLGALCVDRDGDIQFNPTGTDCDIARRILE